MDKKAENVKVPSIPVVVKKGKISLLNNKSNKFLRCLKFNVCKDDIIYKSSYGDFLRGEFPELTLCSRLNLITNNRITIAKFVTNEGKVEKTSSEIAKVIGQNNYDTVFSALCSVISQELRIRAILALLTSGKSYKECATQTEGALLEAPQSHTTSTSSSESSKKRTFRSNRKRPYIVHIQEENEIKRVVIDPSTVLKATETERTPETTQDNDKTTTESVGNDKSTGSHDTFPELQGIINEDSMFSNISDGNVSLSSQHSLNIHQLLVDPTQLLETVGEHTGEPVSTLVPSVPLTLLNGETVMVSVKPHSIFHWASPENLKSLQPADRQKLVYHQAVVDWKFCLGRDEDGYLPIHQAVLANDLEFLKRQCLVLKNKYGSIDFTARGNITALQMSIFKEGERCTATLLQHGADPLLQDDEGKSFIHTAAEVSSNHLRLALEHCRDNAREIVKQDEDLWSPDMENQSDEEITKFLFDHICVSCDNQGYTPLMLASKQGDAVSTRLLVDASPDTVNRPMPNCGSTALYLAVAAACTETLNSTNHTKVSKNFLDTIGILMEAGADPSLENHSSSSVNTLLTEFNIVDLSVLIANKLTAIKYFEGKTFAASNINSYMLYRSSDGQVNVTEIKKAKNGKDKAKNKVKIVSNDLIVDPNTSQLFAILPNVDGNDKMIVTNKKRIPKNTNQTKDKSQVRNVNETKAPKKKTKKKDFSDKDKEIGDSVVKSDSAIVVKSKNNGRPTNLGKSDFYDTSRFKFVKILPKPSRDAEAVPVCLDKGKKRKVKPKIVQDKDIAVKKVKNVKNDAPKLKEERASESVSNSDLLKK